MSAILSWLAADADASNWMLVLLVAVAIFEFLIANLAIRGMRDTTSLLREWIATHSDNTEGEG